MNTSLAQASAFVAVIACLTIACSSGDGSDDGAASSNQHLETGGGGNGAASSDQHPTTGGDDGNPCTAQTTQDQCALQGCDWSGAACHAKAVPASPCAHLQEDACAATKGCAWVRREFTEGGDVCQEKEPTSCVDLGTPQDCQSKIAGCTWSNDACRDSGCADITTQSECDAQQESFFTKGCHWTTSATGDGSCTDS